MYNIALANADNISAHIINVLQQNNATAGAPAGSWNLALSNCEQAVPSASQRLLPLHISNTLSTIFGQNVNAEPGFPIPDGDAGFTTSVAANRVAKGDIRDIAETAESIALSILDRLPTLANCGVTVNDDCAQTYITNIAPTIYRGVYQPQDIENLLALYQTLRGGDVPLAPNLALTATLSSMMQSPAFLYLLEIGEPTGVESERQLTTREIANRMAFLLTGAPPDTELVNAASQGLLSSADGREQEANRLLKVDNSLLNPFFREWFGVNEVGENEQVDEALLNAFNGEFDQLIRQALNDEQAINTLFSRDTTLVNRTLANYYAMDTSATDDSVWVEAPVNSVRGGGLLSTALVGIAHSNLGGTSIVKRGKFVREDLMCSHLGTPPAGAQDMMPILPENSTIRERSEPRSSNATCEVCHREIDPIGLGMEDINDLGLTRESYEISGHPVDSNGLLRGLLVDVASNQTQDLSFNGTAELGAALANSPVVTMCAREQWFTYAMGDDALSQCYSASLGEPINGDTPKTLLIDLVRSNSFILRADQQNPSNEESFR